MASTDRVPRSVYFLGDGLLFDEAIAQMLVSVTNLRLIKRVYVDEAMFLADLHGWQPDVVLLNETDRFQCDQVLTLLSRLPVTAQLRVIALSLAHVKIQIMDLSPGTRTVASRAIKEVTDWNELVDLIAGK